uniref:Uncharacterized protein n=1 Tax=Hucho hucho TaxID=62062 RepID=A0A4W5LTM7_9TELE
MVERGSPHSLSLMESGKILPGVKVVIANTETKGPLGDSHLGEVGQLLQIILHGYLSSICPTTRHITITIWLCMA